MAAFCEVADLAALLQLTIAADDVSALAAIRDASAAIQNYCRQVIEEVEDDEITFDVAVMQSKLFLPELPVTAVASVVEDGEALTEDDDYKLARFGVLHRVGAYWTAGVQTVTVTYSHGYETLPDDVVAVCIRAAARAYQAGLRAAATGGEAGVQAVTIGDYSVRYGSEQSGGESGGGTLGASSAVLLTEAEKQTLSRYRL